ncbi:MAG TPA: glycosyltransferase, partial [Terriglobales bacterium]|nr:glycosyltransferase [Terriglobales bacterium]
NTIAAMHASQAFDLIHAHAALPCGHAASLLGQELNIPFVVTVHGLDVFSSRQGGRILGGWCARVSGQVYRKARAVICISEKVRENVTASLPVPCRVVYNGVDASEFAPTEETASPVTVLSVGNLIPVKGHDLLLRAFARVTSQFDDCRLVIIGEGPERRKLDQLAHRLRISERVRFLGRQSRGEVAAAMANCAAFVLPSSYEGLGCVYLEAMACGKPVIGCHGQGIAEIIRDGKNGLLVTPGDELELADALRTLLRDPHLRRTLGTAARQTVLDGYTLEHQARELVDLYRECVR